MLDLSGVRHQSNRNEPMMIMPSNHSSALFHHLTGRFPNRLGWLIGPSGCSKTKLQKWVPYALDNDAFGAFVNGIEWSEAAWLKMLSWVEYKHPRPMWAIVPDVVADREKTLENWSRYAPVLEEARIRKAFAVQDGMGVDDVPIDADVVFVGGSTEWKWKTLATWTANFERVHVGRVNSVERLTVCERLGVESVDGTGWFRDPSDTSKMDALEAWLGGFRTETQQPEFLLEEVVS